MKELLIGNAAVARGVWEAGATVATAYPGTPSTEITEHIAEYQEVYSEWAPNEKVAMEVAIGASMGGARSIVSMKHVGLNVAADPLFTASYIGTNGGLVVAVADDPGMHSSQNEQDTRYYARSSHLPLLEPSDSQEARDFTKKAFELSEEFDTPVILRLTTRISHSQSLVELHDRENIPLKPYKKNVGKNVMMPAMARARHLVVEEREKRLGEYSETFPGNRIEWGDRDIGIITSGACYQYAREVLPGVSFLKLGLINPLPRKLIELFSAGVRKLYIIEELEPIIEEQIKSWGIEVTGKEKFSVQGEITSRMISESILNEVPDSRIPAELPVRPPVLCPGCPHRAVFYALSTLKLNVTGDKCRDCNGEGRTGKNSKLKVKIPAGVENNSRIRIPGKGNSGTAGGKPGDLIITIQVSPHRYFKRLGYNIEIDLPVTYREAALGAKIEVPTLDGTTLLKIPPSTRSGQKLRLRNMGVINPKTKSKGDMLFLIKIVPPSTKDIEVRELLKKIEEKSPYNPREELEW